MTRSNSDPVDQYSVDFVDQGSVDQDSADQSLVDQDSVDSVDFVDQGSVDQGSVDQSLVDQDQHQLYASEEAEDRRSLRFSLLAALALHVVFLFSTIPTLQQSEAEPAPEPDALLLTPTPRFRPEPPPPEMPPKRRQKVRQIPVPDPDPDHDFYVADIEPDVEIPFDDEPLLGLPDAPPAPEPATDPGPIRIGGHLQRPVRTHYVEPVYPPLARRTRIQGTVVLEATIDTRGRVVDLVVVKGQPMGLSQSALDAVSQWRFEPSKLGETLVPVLFRVEVEFTLR